MVYGANYVVLEIYDIIYLFLYGLSYIHIAASTYKNHTIHLDHLKHPHTPTQEPYTTHVVPIRHVQTKQRMHIIISPCVNRVIKNR